MAKNHHEREIKRYAAYAGLGLLLLAGLYWGASGANNHAARDKFSETASTLFGHGDKWPHCTLFTSDYQYDKCPPAILSNLIWEEFLLKPGKDLVNTFQGTFAAAAAEDAKDSQNQPQTKESKSTPEITLPKTSPLEIKDQNDLINMLWVRKDAQGTPDYEADGTTPKLACYHWTGSSSNTTDAIGPVDIFAEEGRSVIAVTDGSATFEERKDINGTFNIFVHGNDGLYYTYVHVKNVENVVKNGQIQKGAKIAEVGPSQNAGIKTPSHLHFEVTQKARFPNQAEWISDKSTGRQLANWGFPCPDSENYNILFSQNQPTTNPPEQQNTPSQPTQKPTLTPTSQPTSTAKEPTVQPQTPTPKAEPLCPGNKKPIDWNSLKTKITPDLLENLKKTIGYIPGNPDQKNYAGDMYVAKFLMQDLSGQRDLPGSFQESLADGNFQNSTLALCNYNNLEDQKTDNNPFYFGFDCNNLDLNPLICPN